MSQKELDKYEIIKKTINRELTNADAARLLSLSIRQVKRLKKAVKERGAAALIHGNRGKPSNRRLPDKERQKIISLLRERYHDFGPTFACEKLEEYHSIDHDPGTIRSIMIAEKLYKPRKGKVKSEHRSWRQRKDCFGEMIQFDGSYEHWFEDREGTGEVCLLAAIDDAASTLIDAQFDKHEGVVPVFSFWKNYLSVHGKPRAVYLDKFSTYRMHRQEARENMDTRTQFQRVMETLAIEPIFANSPQAKGRIERLFGTLQGRLVKELRLRGISTIKGANRFLREEFIPDFNQRFAVAPRRKTNLHTSLAQKERSNLDSIFCKQAERIVQNDFTIRHNKQWYQLAERQPVNVFKKDRVTAEEHLNGTVHFRSRGKELNYQILPNRPKQQKNMPWVLPASLPQTRKQPAYHPPATHPWKRKIKLNIAKYKLKIH